MKEELINDILNKKKEVEQINEDVKKQQAQLEVLTEQKKDILKKLFEFGITEENIESELEKRGKEILTKYEEIKGVLNDRHTESN